MREKIGYTICDLGDGLKACNFFVDYSTVTFNGLFGTPTWHARPAKQEWRAVMV